MKPALQFAQAIAAVFVLVLTFGCAPPAATDYDTTPAVEPSTDSNVTATAETPVVEEVVTEEEASEE